VGSLSDEARLVRNVHQRRSAGVESARGTYPAIRGGLWPTAQPGFGGRAWSAGRFDAAAPRHALPTMQLAPPIRPSLPVGLVPVSQYCAVQPEAERTTAVARPMVPGYGIAD